MLVKGRPQLNAIDVIVLAWVLAVAICFGNSVMLWESMKSAEEEPVWGAIRCEFWTEVIQDNTTARAPSLNHPLQVRWRHFKPCTQT